MYKPEQRILFYKPFSQYSKQQLVRDQRAKAVRKFVLNQDTRIETELEITQQLDASFTTQAFIKIPRQKKRFDMSPKQFPSLGHYSPKYDLVQRRQPTINFALQSLHTSKSVTKRFDFLDQFSYPQQKIKGSVVLAKQTDRLNISTNLEGPHPERFSPIKESFYQPKVKKIPSTSFYLNSPRNDPSPLYPERAYSPKYNQVRRSIGGVRSFEKTLGRSHEIMNPLSFNESTAYEYNTDDGQNKRKNHSYLFNQTKFVHEILPTHMNKQNTSRLQLQTFSQKMLEQNGNI